MTSLASLITLPNNRRRITLAAAPIIAAIGIGAFTATAAHAQAGSTYNFEFVGDNTAEGATQIQANTPYNGTGAYSGSGNNWNLIREASGTQTLSNAVASNGTASAVSFTINGAVKTFSNAGDNVAANPDQLITNYAYSTGGATQTFSFSGLTANAPFTVYLYGSNGTDQNNRGTTFNLTNSTFGTIFSSASTVNQTKTSFVQNDNYVVLSGTTDVTGSAYASYKNNTATGQTEGDFNGAQLRIGSAAAAPEPVSIALVALAGLPAVGVIARRRRKTA